MFEKLDTLIAFAVVMLGLSMIITILTQMASAFLSLRGANLLWGVETLFKELAPNLVAQGIVPRELAQEFLTHQLVSDSSFSRMEKMWMIGPLMSRLSQAPVIGWIVCRWRYATAIRPEELVRLIRMKIDELPDGGAKTELTSLLNAADSEVQRKLQMLSTALPGINLGGGATNYSVQIDKILQQVTDTANQAVGQLEHWFGSTMDRVSQRFALQMRLWTVVFAFVLAFGAHIDSLNLLDQLSTNPTTREALVKMSDGMMKEAQAIMPAANAAPAAGQTPMSPEILNEALQQLKKQQPALVPGVDKIPATATTLDDAVTWLTSQANVGVRAGDEFRKAVITVLYGHAQKIQQNLATAGIQLVPSPYHPFQFNGWRNFTGILLAAAFLSLGAPFWFNALKNLSNLRTVVASKQKQESAG